MTTNVVLLSMLPLPVQQVAAAQRLGAFLKAYKTSLIRTILGAFVFMVAAALFCAGGIFPPDLTVTTRVVLLVFGLLFLGLAIFLVYSVIQVANQQIYLFQQGIRSPTPVPSAASSCKKCSGSPTASRMGSIVLQILENLRVK
jgi:hypothetical protein